jgi:hypothetical protein
VHGENPQRVGLLQAAVFLDELALLAVLALAGAGLPDATALRIALAVLFPLAAAVVWGLWFAPRAKARLPYPKRLIGKLALTAVAAALLVAADRTGLAIAFYVVSAALLTAGEVSESRHTPYPHPR